MAQKILGNQEFLEQPQQDTFEQGVGKTTVRSWKGGRDKYDAAFTTILALSPDTMSGVKGTPAEITATFLPADQAMDNAVWELIPTSVDRPLGTHPSFNTSGGLQEFLEDIDVAVAKGTGHDTDWDADSGYSGLNDYRNLKAKGTDSFRMWSFIVRRTISTSLAGLEQASDQDAGLVVDWSGIGIPVTVKFDQPYYNKWDGDTVTPIAIDQWLTSPETVRYEKKRYTVTKEWLGSLGWYSILYSGGNALSTADGTNLG